MNNIQKYLDELLELSKRHRYGLWYYNNIIQLLQVENFVLFKDDLREFISKQKAIFNEIDTKYFNKKIIYVRNKRRTERTGKDEFTKEITSNKIKELNRLGKIIGFLESGWLPYVETKQKSLGYIVSLQADFHKPSDNTINLNNANVVSENEREKELSAYLRNSKNENTTYCTIFMDKYYSFCSGKITNENALKKTLQFYGLYSEEKFESDKRAFYKKNKPPKPNRRISKHTLLKNKIVNQVHQ